VSAVSVELPELLHKQVQELAQQEGITLEYFMVLAVAEKMV
jgi:predicted transcriptional regulator